MPEVCFSETTMIKSVGSLWEVKKGVSIQMNEVYEVEEILGTEDKTKKQRVGEKKAKMYKDVVQVIMKQELLR